MAEPTTTEYDDGVKSKLQDGKIKFTFPQLRDVTGVNVQAAVDAGLEVVVVTDTGTTEAMPLTSDENTPAENVMSVPDATAVIIRKANGDDINPDDIISIEVKACEEGLQQYFQYK